jgi:histidine ammonia-lyase
MRTDPQATKEVLLDGGNLALTSLDAMLGSRLQIRLSDDVRRRIDSGAKAVERIAQSNVAAYGINTGFGNLCTKRIAPDQLSALQTNLLISHAVGVGPPIAADLVRWMMLLKIQALTRGVSGVSLSTVDAFAALLNVDALPIVPVQGSLGASGDLAPLAHLALPLIGRGELLFDGRVRPAGEVLAALGMSPIVPKPKESLALINGTQFMGSHAAHIAVRARRLVRHADLIAAMSLEGCAGSIRPFDERLHRVRPHLGAMETADNMRAMMKDSEILASHANCDRVQDPYSLRCVPQVHGASRDALRHASQVIETEINSVTDNPLIFDNGDVVSGGLFHGQPLALVLDYLAIALSELASISERRTYLLLSGVGGLPLLLLKDTGLCSGFMMPQYTAAALVSENKGLCTPASVDSIPTSLGQEDHVSMGARAAVKCLQVLENAETVLAIEMLCAAQAIDFRVPLRPGVGPAAAHRAVRKSISHATVDRAYGDDMKTALTLLRSQGILCAVEAAIGTLH